MRHVELLPNQLLQSTSLFLDWRAIDPHTRSLAVRQVGETFSPSSEETLCYKLQ